MLPVSIPYPDWHALHTNWLDTSAHPVQRAWTVEQAENREKMNRIEMDIMKGKYVVYGSFNRDMALRNKLCFLSHVSEIQIRPKARENIENILQAVVSIVTYSSIKFIDEIFDIYSALTHPKYYIAFDTDILNQLYLSKYFGKNDWNHVY